MPIRPRSGRSRGRAPQEVVLQLGRAGMLEAEDLAALRIDARHHVLDRAVLARRVHRLEDQQHSVAVGGIEQLLLRAEFRYVVGQQLLVVRFRFVDRPDPCRPFLEVDLVVFAHAKVFGIDFHVSPSLTLAGSSSAYNHQVGATVKGGLFCRQRLRVWR